METDLKPTNAAGTNHSPVITVLPTSPPGPADRGFLQHCHVHALLPWIDAVDHQKGIETGRDWVTDIELIISRTKF